MTFVRHIIGVEGEKMAEAAYREYDFKAHCFGRVFGLVFDPFTASPLEKFI